MTQYEMTEKLSEKCNVTLEEAKAALEAGEWNMLTATHLMEQEKFRRMQQLNQFASSGEAVAVQFAPEEGAADEAEADTQATTGERIDEAGCASGSERIDAAGRAESRKRRHSQGFRNLGGHIRRLVACGNRNRLEVRKDGKLVLELPVTVLAVFLLCAFWVCVPLLVIGLFTGCQYSFGGRELGRESVNSALARASKAADHMKETVARA